MEKKLFNKLLKSTKQAVKMSKIYCVFCQSKKPLVKGKFPVCIFNKTEFLYEQYFEECFFCNDCKKKFYDQSQINKNNKEYEKALERIRDQ